MKVANGQNTAAREDNLVAFPEERRKAMNPITEKTGATKVYAKTNKCQLLLKLKFPTNTSASKANSADRSRGGAIFFL